MLMISWLVVEEKSSLSSMHLYENHADVVGAINVLERGHRLLACGESAQLGRSVKQEPAEASQAQV